MEQIKEQIAFSKKAQNEFERTENALKELTQHIINTAKQTNTYLVVGDGKGGVRKIPAKDL